MPTSTTMIKIGIRTFLHNQELTLVKLIWSLSRVPTFDGNPDPEFGHDYLKHVETQLHLLEVLEEHKVEVLTPFLQENWKW